MNNQRELADATGSLTEFLEEVALATDLDMDKGDDDRVALMTVHLAKGLWWDYYRLGDALVGDDHRFDLGLEEDLFGHDPDDRFLVVERRDPRTADQPHVVIGGDQVDPTGADAGPQRLLVAFLSPTERWRAHIPGGVEPGREILARASALGIDTRFIRTAPGAATGSGGEIRDEGATGRGSKPKAGLTGFSVSNLHLPGAEQPWELSSGRPARIVSALDIMLEGPIGAAAFNNEFGRPNLCGYFRTYEQDVAHGDGSELRGYHKPIMLAGGVGNIREEHIEKKPFPAGTPLIVLGGPAMLIGLGGGAASSMASGTSAEELDFASVQRSNPEMERRCQEVIDRCWARGGDNPVLFIHDVGAGGLSNALPELVHDGGKGGKFELRDVPNDDPGMTPMEIWCNEAQERYVLAVDAGKLEEFKAICERERCPYAVVGEATDEEHLLLGDSHFKKNPIDMPMSLLFGKPPRMHRDVMREHVQAGAFAVDGVDLAAAARRVLEHPAVASKRFLITIGDRSITGMVARDQMVGPWQVPVADVAVMIVMAFPPRPWGG